MWGKLPACIFRRIWFGAEGIGFLAMEGFAADYRVCACAGMCIKAAGNEGHMSYCLNS